MKDSGLSKQQLDFIRFYVANGGNGKDAAIKAGYSAATAKVQASRLLARPDIQAEIERLRESIRRSAQAIMVAATPREETRTPAAEIIPPHEQDGITAAIVATLTRNYIRTNLMEIVQIGLGKRPTEITKIIKETKKLKDNTVKEELTAIKLESHERDLAAAVRALELLEKEVTKDEIAAGTAGAAKDITPSDARNQRMREWLNGIRPLMPQPKTAV